MLYIIPKITWGASFANTLSIGYPLDNWSSYSAPREGSEWTQSESGLEDAWIIADEYILEADVRWIPTTASVSPAATGWDGTTGFRAFLEWARRKNEFRFFPNSTSATYLTSYLVEPMNAAPTIEPDGTRRIRMTIRNASGSYDNY